MATALEKLREARAKKAAIDTSLDAIESECESENRSGSRSTPNVHVGRMPLVRFSTAAMIVPLYSEVLAEKAYFVSDNAEVAVDDDDLYRGRVVYRASELAELLTCNADTIRLVNEVKKGFRGKVVGHGLTSSCRQTESMPR